MEERVRAILAQYKKDILPAILFLAGVVLFVWLILPQITEVPDLLSELKTQKETNEGLVDSSNTLLGLSDSKLDDDYMIALKALPPGKSIASIFEALTIAADKTNVSIGSLNLQVGSVYDQDPNKVERNNIQGIPFINLLVRVNGSSSTELTEYARVLYETVPIIEVNSIGVSEEEGRYDVNFYFKPINEKGFAAQNLVTDLTFQQQELLKKLYTWLGSN